MSGCYFLGHKAVVPSSLGSWFQDPKLILRSLKVEISSTNAGLELGVLTSQSDDCRSMVVSKDAVQKLHERLEGVDIQWLTAVDIDSVFKTIFERLVADLISSSVTEFTLFLESLNDLRKKQVTDDFISGGCAGKRITTTVKTDTFWTNEKINSVISVGGYELPKSFFRKAAGTALSRMLREVLSNPKILIQVDTGENVLRVDLFWQ